MPLHAEFSRIGYLIKANIGCNINCVICYLLCYLLYKWLITDPLLGCITDNIN